MKMRRPMSPRSASTRLAISGATSPSCSISRDFRLAVVGHQRCPAPVEATVVAFTVTVIAGDGTEIRLKPLASEPHRIVQRMAPRDDASAGLGAALPIVHVVLLKRAARSEHTGSREADRLLDLGRRRPVCIDEGPAFGLVGTTRMPDAQSTRGRPQDRQIRKDRGSYRIAATDARPQ